jgi:hypothetical protein
MVCLFIPGSVRLDQAGRILHRELREAFVESIKPRGTGVLIRYRRMTPEEIKTELMSCIG